jgi:predicted transcriptional regulator of viral defense system
MRVTDTPRFSMFAGPMRNPNKLVSATAAHQYGLITWTQAIACGLTPEAIHWLVISGRWEKALPRVYRIAGSPPSWHQSLMAATLWAGEARAASYRAAARLWSFKGFAEEIVEISTTSRVRKRPPGIIVHRPRRLLPGEITEVDGIPVTTPARTIIDLCALRMAKRAERALDDALRRELTTLDELRNYLRMEARQGRNGVTLMREFLEVRDPSYVPTDSWFEDDLDALISSSILPPPVRQHPLFQVKRLIRVFDFAYPEALLGIEGQSWEYHGDRIAWSKDQGKDNAAAPLGWVILRYTKYDIDERPHEVIEEIRATRESRLHILSRATAI